MGFAAGTCDRSQSSRSRLGLTLASAMLSYLTLSPANAATVSATASSSFISSPSKTLDGSLSSSSRWSSYGDQQWIKYDLGASYPLQSVDIAYYLGNGRIYYLDIESSADGKQWTPMFSGQSSGTTANFQNFDFADQTARFLRIVGHGNNANRWNHILELNIHYDTSSTSVAASAVSTPVYKEDFESYTAGNYWKNKTQLLIKSGCGVNSSKCVRVTYNPTFEGSERISVNETLPAAQEYTLNYDVYFESDFQWVRGGKLPGLGPQYQTTGCKEQTTKGWSVREMWRDNGQPVFYVYDQNRAKECGEQTNSGLYFEKSKWYAMSVYVKVNSPASSANGTMQLYMNGALIIEVNNAQLRGEEGNDTLINKLLFHTFFGGSDSSWSPTKSVHSRFDNLAVYPGLRVRSAAGL